jgi:hypothetical protein
VRKENFELKFVDLQLAEKLSPGFVTSPPFPSQQTSNSRQSELLRRTSSIVTLTSQHGGRREHLPRGNEQNSNLSRFKAIATRIRENRHQRRRWKCHPHSRRRRTTSRREPQGIKGRTSQNSRRRSFKTATEKVISPILLVLSFTNCLLGRKIVKR